MPNDVALAADLARTAGERLLEVRAGARPGPDLGRTGDRAAQQLLADGLALARPDDAVLSEEAADDRRRLQADRVWIIDPLDGTREFAEGRHDWAVHVALWQGGDLVAGAVALPGLGVVLDSGSPALPGLGVVLDSGSPALAGLGVVLDSGSPALPGLGVVLDSGSPPPRRATRVPRLAVSRSRPPACATALAASLGFEMVPMGSAGFKVGAIVRGEADVYVHAGGQYEWDSAAPVAVARAAGLYTSRLDGSPLAYNQPDVLLPDLVVCRPELAASVLATLTRSLDDVAR